MPRHVLHLCCSGRRVRGPQGSQLARDRARQRPVQKASAGRPTTSCPLVNRSSIHSQRRGSLGSNPRRASDGDRRSTPSRTSAPGITAAQRLREPDRGDASWPTRSGSTCSASASTTGPTSRSPRRRSCWPAGAARTERIRLTSAVTVLSSDDPVRVFQDFATLDLLSGGRAEIMAGRGSFIESFPLFGYDLDDYDELFAEKLELLLALRDGERVTWSGPAPRAARRRRRLPAPAAGPAAGLDRGRRHAAVGRARRRRSGCRWRSRSSAASRSASRRSSTSTARPRARPGTTRRAAGGINSHAYVADTRSRRPTSSSRPMRR